MLVGKARMDAIIDHNSECGTSRTSLVLHLLPTPPHQG